ncbi:hypothetical protein [Rudanella lutea]|uniref:hypothetical protein n=1 Tax=Rudanella lutea TaxID=451374 RepID=UPI0003725FD8|nr:hypothetical protein [Rudanella lutea]
MKPDNFSDRIRQKLEGIEPEFREKDWTRMQQVLGHSTPVYAIGTKAGLMAAASVVAVMAFGGVAYQQYRTNQELREEVKTLTQTVKVLRETGPERTVAAAPLPPDTVYLTRDVVRYVAVPVDRVRPGEPAPDGVTPPTEQVAGTATESAGNAHAETARTTPEQADLASTPASAQNTTNSPTTPYATETTTTSTHRLLGGKTRTNRPNRSATPTGVSDSQRPNRTDYAVAGQNNVSGPAGAGVGNGQTPYVGAQPTAEANGPSASRVVQLEYLESRPFVRDTAYYQEGMARANRRIRRLFGLTAPTPTAVAGVIADRSDNDWKVRVGTGANVGWRQWGAGLFGELRLNNHWRVGLGLTALDLQGASFLTDVDYGRRMKQDFRSKFAPGIDPRHDIMNIQLSGSAWQVPISLSYRIGLAKGWSVVPSASVALSVSNREETRFTYLRGPRMVEPVTTVWRPAQQMMHAGSVAIYLEKNWGDWALQLGSYASTPMSSMPSRLNVTTAGAGARLFYQIDWKKKKQ